jgi:hypothetical protein
MASAAHRCAAEHRLRITAVDDIVKTNIFGFRATIFSCDIQGYIWDDQAYDNLSVEKD